MLLDLSPAARPQYDLFDRQDRQKQQATMTALDAVNRRFGAGTLFYAGAGITPAWRMKRGRKSPHYTTDWESVPRVACGHQAEAMAALRREEKYAWREQ